ncbi:MAG: DUF2155 domain-containing protein [Pseudomonadota bacterium]
MSLISAALARLALLVVGGILLTANQAHPASPIDQDRGYAILRLLDKSTAKTSQVTVPVGKMTQFRSIRIKVHACRTKQDILPAGEQPENAAFLEVLDETSGGIRIIFSGWMFTLSPSLSSLEHPIYDVWLNRCVDEVSN